MVDNDTERADDRSGVDEKTDGGDVLADADAEPLALAGAYKVLGRLDDPTGTGVRGRNDAASGTPIGVEGVVPNTDGFGLATPDDARIEGALDTAGRHRLTVDGTTALEATPSATSVAGDLAMAGSHRVLVDGRRSVRLDANATKAGNVVLGHDANEVKDGAAAAVIGGGGFRSQTDNRANVVTDDYGVVAGGKNNIAGTTADSDPGTGSFATISGGVANRAAGKQTTVAGGRNNVAGALNAAIGGGRNNSADGDTGTVGGGRGNAAKGKDATVAGGSNNLAHDDQGTVAGGANNEAGRPDADTTTAPYATVGGGLYNRARGKYATIAGGGPDDDKNGSENAVYDDYGTIGGGGRNRVGTDDQDTTNAPYGTVSGGRNNTARRAYATVSGGRTNETRDEYATIGGGHSNTVTSSRGTIAGGQGGQVLAEYGTIGGGQGNRVDDDHGTVGGGHDNRVGTATSGSTDEVYGTIGGGYGNRTRGTYATVPGGRSNVAAGDYSMAAGRNAEDNDHDGAFVWGDSSSNTVTADADDQVVLQAGGTRSSGAAVTIYSQSNDAVGVELPANDSTWQSLSARSAKTDISPVDGPAVLDAVADLEVSTWRYDGQDDAVTHMGPMAGEIAETFGLGHDDRHVAPLDLAGLALAAIKGIAAEREERDGRIDALEAENARLRERLAAVEACVDLGTDAAEDIPADD